MSLCEKIDEITGYAIEKKFIFSSKIATANLYILFRENIENLLESSQILELNNENSFHTFLLMLELIAKLVDDKNNSSKAPNFSRIECLINSNKFFYPRNLITIKKNNDLIIKQDDDLNNEENIDLMSLFKHKESLNRLIECSSVKIDNAFGNKYVCRTKHNHSSCDTKLNLLIENDFNQTTKFNKSNFGVKLFDYIICFIKILQIVEIELLGILFLKMLNNEQIYDSLYFDEIKEKLLDLGRRITLQDLSYILQLNIIKNKHTQLVLELIECHFSKNISRESPPPFHYLPMFD